MTTAFQYLEAAKIEEVAAKLKGEGYEVTVSPTGDDEGYDLVAKKDDKKMAVEVKVNAQLREAAESIKSLRRRAIESGYDEFRLVVVSPPRKVAVRITGLEAELCEYLRNNLPKELDELSDFTGPERVSNIVSNLFVGNLDVDSIEVAGEGIRLVGSGVLEVSLHFGRFGDVSVPLKTDFPFSFDVQLDHNLKISKVYKIEVDTSSFDK